MRFILIIFLLLLRTHFLSGQINENLTVAFSEIDSTEYFAFSLKYSNDVLMDSTKKTIVDSSFFLRIKNKDHPFKYEFDNRYYYHGYLTSLDSYILTHCETQLCETFLINRTTGDKLYLESTFDNEAEIPVISKGENMMLVFANNVFSPSSYISLYKRNQNKNKLNFHKVFSLSKNNWVIDNAIWVSDNCIALKISDYTKNQEDDESIAIKYVIGKIK